MDKLYLAGRNLGRVFGYRCGRVSTQFSTGMMSKQPNLKLKIQHGQLLGYLPLAIDINALPFTHPPQPSSITSLCFSAAEKKSTDVYFSLSM